jgi:hypothetical protein
MAHSNTLFAVVACTAVPWPLWPPSPTQKLLLLPWAAVLPSSAFLLPLLLALLQLIVGMSHSSSARALLLLLLLQLEPLAWAAVLPTYAVLPIVGLKGVRPSSSTAAAAAVHATLVVPNKQGQQGQVPLCALRPSLHCTGVTTACDCSSWHTHTAVPRARAAARALQAGLCTFQC